MILVGTKKETSKAFVVLVDDHQVIVWDSKSGGLSVSDLGSGIGMNSKTILFTQDEPDEARDYFLSMISEYGGRIESGGLLDVEYPHETYGQPEGNPQQG